MHSPTRRRELGAFYTPVDVAERLVAIALDGVVGAPRVCDPACGDGAFLLAAARALAARGLAPGAIARDLLWGTDIDPGAVDAARDSITAWAGTSPGDHLVVADGLDDIGWSARFDVVIGNPPFLNQLQRATTRNRATRWEGRFGPYADTAFVFLLVALELVRPGGRVLLLQPQSLAASRDAAPIRDAVLRAGALRGMWTCNEPVFDANVRVCAPVLERGAAQPDDVARWCGRAADAIAPRRWRGARTWSPLLVAPHPTPPVRIDGLARLGEMASATAGFRDQFYGLAPHVVDRARADERALPRLVTCGVIDPAHSAWGQRPVRFAGRQWRHPRVDLAGLDDGPLRRWVLDRLVPKVVLATQTKVLEAAVDVAGEWVPSTPVIAVHADREALFRVAAVLSSPPVSAWAATEYAGVALTSDSLKLSARQVLDIPLPGGHVEWERAAAALRGGDLLASGRWMTAAYHCSGDVFEWWARRLPQ